MVAKHIWGGLGKASSEPARILALIPRGTPAFKLCSLSGIPVTNPFGISYFAIPETVPQSRFGRGIFSPQAQHCFSRFSQNFGRRLPLRSRLLNASIHGSARDFACRLPFGFASLTPAKRLNIKLSRIHSEPKVPLALGRGRVLHRYAVQCAPDSRIALG